MKNMLKVSLLLAIVFSFCSAFDQKSVLFETNIKTFIGKIQNYLTPILVKLESSDELSVNCSQAFNQTFRDALQLKWWALQMYDSSGRFPIGLIDGTFGSMGDFEECVDIESGTGVEPPFIGQYCTPRFEFPFDFERVYPSDSVLNRTLPLLKQFHTPIVTNAFCIPSICSPTDFKAILSEILNPLDIETHLDGNDCYHKQEIRKLSKSQTRLLYFITATAVLLVVSTLVDYLCESGADLQKYGILSSIVDSFSLFRNVKRFLAEEANEWQTNGQLDLKIFDFFKVFVLVYVISSHIFLNGLLSFQIITFKYRQVLEMGKDFSSQVMTNSAVFIEIIFYMSGCLTVISGLKYFESRRGVPFKLYFISRYIRVIPVQLVTIGMTVLLAMLGSGPAFKYYYNKQIRNCDENMWKNLLFIANYDKYNLMCSSQTWFISADLQLFILSFFALQLLAKKPKYGLIYCIFFVLLGMVIPGALNLWFNIAPPIIRVKNEGLAMEEEKVHISHCSTYSHFTEYFMGMINGYIILKIERINLSDLSQNILSLGSVLLSVSMVFSTYLLNGLQWEGFELFYSSFMRFFFTLGLCWMTVSLARGNKGPSRMFNVFSYLSNKKLSKICFSATMINIELIRFVLLTQTTLKDRKMLPMLVIVIGFVVISLLCGFVIHICVEMPFNNLFVNTFKSIVLAKNKKSK